MADRTVSELEAYATRLHRVDPNCKEEIPVSPAEAFAVHEHVARKKGFTTASALFDLQLLGHKVKIL